MKTDSAPMPLVIIDIPGRYSRVLGEQVPDSHYANPIDAPEPTLLSSITNSLWFDRLCWIAFVIGVGVFVWHYFAFPRPIWWQG